MQLNNVDQQLDTIKQHVALPNKVACLTFDDGPSIYTEDLLNILKERNIPAIFFVVGINVIKVPNAYDIIKRIHAENHHIGLHSMTHDREKLYHRADSPQFFVDEMRYLENLLGYILDGYHTKLCRAPYGSFEFTKGHWKSVKKAKLYSLDWNIDSSDWEIQSADEIFERVVMEAEKAQFPHTIVLLFHEHARRTLEVIPRVINYFQDKGYTFVSYAEGDRIAIQQNSPPPWYDTPVSYLRKMKKICKKLLLW